MPARLDYVWRLFVTAFSFIVFGMCGILFSLIAFPLASIWPHRASRQRAIATLIHWFFRALVTALQRAGVMKLDLAGVHALRSGTPAIVVANHPTYLDVVVLLSLTPRACCVVKSAHWSNPCLWGIVRVAEYVSNADPAGFVQDCTRQIESGYSMIIFPEGSRSPAPNRLHAFSRGFAHTALETGVPILPVLMHCDPPAFTRQMRWYHVPERPFRMSVNVLEPVGVQPFAQHDMPSALAARNVTRAIESHITRYLFDYGFFKAGN